MPAFGNRSWEASAREQRQAWLKLSYRQRLAWLWQAKQFARKPLGAAKGGRRK